MNDRVVRVETGHMQPAAVVFDDLDGFDVVFGGFHFNLLAPLASQVREAVPVPCCCVHGVIIGVTLNNTRIIFTFFENIFHA